MSDTDTRIDLRKQFDLHFTGGERKAVAFLKKHSWLLIPNVTARSLEKGYVGCYAEVHLADEYRADFAVYYKESSELHWEFIEVQAPDAKVLSGINTRYASQFSEALHQVESWDGWFRRNSHAAEARFPNSTHARAFRIVIGRSDSMSVQEREALQDARSGRRRIRTFCWFYDKLDRFDIDEIDRLESLGIARTHSELRKDKASLLKLLSSRIDRRYA